MSYAKLNPELKARWVAALRSSEYKQGRYLLRNDENEFCCLGVLCDTYDSSRWVLENMYRHEYAYMSNDCVVPHEIKKAINFDVCAESALIGMNDKKFYDFAQIADWVEENL
jgi:hypothetical protein